MPIEVSLNTNTAEVEDRIPYVINLVTNATLNTKATTEIENKISDITGFITILELNRLIKIGFGARKKEAVRKSS